MAFNLEKAIAEQPVIREPVPVVPGRKVHVDGDYLAYKAAGNDETSAGTARGRALDIIKDFTSRTGSESAVVHITSPGCHKGERYLAATVKPYQGQRDPGRKPKNHAYLFDWLMGYDGPDFRKKVWASREADDGIAACAQFAAQQGKLDGIATADKDMRMLPGIHATWANKWGDPEWEITVPTADTYALWGKDGKLYGLKWFWMQMLHGDTADHIPGLEYVFEQVKKGGEERMNKVGPAAADRLLTSCDTHDAAGQRVLDLYVRSYRGMGPEVGYDRFAEQACLLWLRRGNKAHVCDFMDYLPPALQNNSKLLEAGARMTDRITAAREALNVLAE